MEPEHKYISTEHIQSMLDENSAMIVEIIQLNNAVKHERGAQLAEVQDKLDKKRKKLNRNLMTLAKWADESTEPPVKSAPRPQHRPQPQPQQQHPQLHAQQPAQQPAQLQTHSQQGHVASPLGGTAPQQVVAPVAAIVHPNEPSDYTQDAASQPVAVSTAVDAAPHDDHLIKDDSMGGDPVETEVTADDNVKDEAVKYEQVKPDESMGIDETNDDEPAEDDPKDEPVDESNDVAVDESNDVAVDDTAPTTEDKQDELMEDEAPADAVTTLDEVSMDEPAVEETVPLVAEDSPASSLDVDDASEEDAPMAAVDVAEAVMQDNVPADEDAVAAPTETEASDVQVDEKAEDASSDDAPAVVASTDGPIETLPVAASPEQPSPEESSEQDDKAADTSTADAQDAAATP
ncbi:Aste57867_6928 [Aphanomyces stellatus]|uniref:Aste57867_6928 protein n=1 Tax=Aphanomyces stellatus TaxID=120398 RepID=A0A485KF84_9STRA|nr:hypothetical protein As57867_006906 [Aphanomyces stellatus]VFT83880.1 Aste57867_6928 [Aphanomyces stellatus]